MIVYVRQHGIWISGTLIHDDGAAALIDLVTGPRVCCLSSEYTTTSPRHTTGEWPV